MHRYQLVYSVKGAPLAFADHDELNWDSIGNQWPVPIHDARVTVTATSPITRLTCFSGPQGSVLPCDSESAPGYRTATFTQRLLDPGSGLTTVVAVPKFAIDPQPAPILETRRNLLTAFALTAVTVSLGAGVALVGIGLVITLATRRGRDRRYTGSAVDAAMGNTTGAEEPAPVLHRTTGPVEFVPPDGIRPGEVGTLLDEHANLLDVTATIVDLAVRGWLTIKEIAPDAHERHHDYELAETEGTRKGTLLPYEQKLLNELFDNRETVRLSDLKYQFRASLSEIQSAMYDDTVTQGWYRFRPDHTRARWVVIGGVTLAVGVGTTALVGDHHVVRDRSRSGSS